jgi:adenosylhomocysteine nucleosidase
MTRVRNSGVVTFSGNTHITGSAIGDGAVVSQDHPESHPARTDEPGNRTLGVVTVLAEEMSALIQILELSEHHARPAEQVYYTGRIAVGDRESTVVATRALGQGQRSMMASLNNLWHRYQPAVLVLVGIGGGTHDDVTLDDVVVATRVIYYDLRKVTTDGVQHRGEERHAPADVAHGVNAFFTHHGEPAKFLGAGSDPFRVYSGPIGSGEAVIADGDSEIRTYLSRFNDKILAVDMEAGGLSQFCHETSSDGRGPGWVVLRGIADHANVDKSDDHHRSAAANAAQTLRELAPYLLRGA